MGLGDKLRRRALRDSVLVGVTRLKFHQGEVAFVDEWSDAPDSDLAWWRVFAACGHAMHIANTLGDRDPQSHAIKAAFVDGDPPLTAFGSDFEIVSALPLAHDEMAVEVWAGVSFPIVQSALSGRGAKHGRYALAAAGLAAVHFDGLCPDGLLDAAVRAHGGAIEQLGWEPGDRHSALAVQVAALGLLSDLGYVSDPYQFGTNPEATTGERSPLLEASDRLDEHVIDAPVDEYFKLILLACSASAYGALADFAGRVQDGSEDCPPDGIAIVSALDEPAAADRAVKAVTWMMLSQVIADEWPDRWSEVADLACTAIPIDARGLRAVDELVVAVGKWSARLESDLDDPDELDDDAGIAPEDENLARISYWWLVDEVLRRQVACSEEDLGPLAWHVAMVRGFGKYFEYRSELEAQHPDVRPE